MRMMPDLLAEHVSRADSVRSSALCRFCDRPRNADAPDFALRAPSNLRRLTLALATPWHTERRTPEQARSFRQGRSGMSPVSVVHHRGRI